MDDVWFIERQSGPGWVLVDRVAYDSFESAERQAQHWRETCYGQTPVRVRRYAPVSDLTPNPESTRGRV